MLSTEAKPKEIIVGYQQQKQAEERRGRYVAKRIAALASSYASRKPDADALAAAADLADRKAVAHASRQAIDQGRAQDRKAALRARGLAAHARHLARQQERKRQRLAERGEAAPAPAALPVNK